MPVLRSVLLVALSLVVASVLSGCGRDEQQPADSPLPRNFPAAQVPLLDGEVVDGYCPEERDCEGDWQVTVQVQQRDGVNPLEDAVALLTEAGYTEELRGDDGAGRWVRLVEQDGDTRYTVTVTSAALGVVYLVTRS